MQVAQNNEADDDAAESSLRRSGDTTLMWAELPFF